MLQLLVVSAGSSSPLQEFSVLTVGLAGSLSGVSDELVVDGVRASSKEDELLHEVTSGCSVDEVVSGDERVELPDGLHDSGYVRRSSAASTPVMVEKFLSLVT